MQVEQIGIETLIPYANNARTHSEAQVAQIAASIREFGFNNPVLIDEQSSIIAGHGRVLAARKLELDAVPCIRLNHLSETQRRAYIIADNKIAMNAGWDEELLALELTELTEFGVNMDLTGFTVDEIAELNPKITEGLTDEDAVPEVPETPITKLGDVWLLDKHRVMCGDSTSIDAVEKLMDGQKADLVITSPPYNQGGGKGDLFSHGKRVESLYQNNCDNKTAPEYFDFCISVFNVIKTILSNNHTILWNVSYNAKSRDDYGKIVFSKENPFTVKETILWNKGGSINLPQSGIYSRKVEMIFIMSNYDGYLTNQQYGDCRWNYWETKKINQRVDHKATFTVELPDRAIDEFSFDGNIIYDPFGGSGTTLISSEKKKRSSMLMELDPKYVDVIVKRWQEFTGKKSTLESTGVEFDLS